MKNWIIRTKNLNILGPVSRKKVMQLYESRDLTGDDEICSGNGFWFYVREADLVKKYLFDEEVQTFNPVSNLHNTLDDFGNKLQDELPPALVSDDMTVADIKLSTLDLNSFDKDEITSEYNVEGLENEISSETQDLIENAKIPDSIPDIALEDMSVKHAKIQRSTMPKEIPDLPIKKQRNERTLLWGSILILSLIIASVLFFNHQALKKIITSSLMHEIPSIIDDAEASDLMKDSFFIDSAAQKKNL